MFLGIILVGVLLFKGLCIMIVWRVREVGYYDVSMLEFCKLGM